MSKNKNLYLGFLLFVLINVALYLFLINFNSLVSLNKFNYEKNSQHYFTDSRIRDGNFDFLRALGQFDAQWYLKIANQGYIKNPKDFTFDKENTFNTSFAFFPIYPLLIAAVNIPISDIEIAAFIITNLLLVLIYFSLYVVISKLYTPNLAQKTIFLIFLFPFSIFFRSYFTEGLFLLGVVWFSYFLIKKHFLPTAILAGILAVTRGVGIFLIPVLIFYMIKAKLPLQKKIIYTTISLIPFFLWILYCHVTTGDPFYFVTVKSAWKENTFTTPFYNLLKIFLFPQLPLHSFHFSKIDVTTVVVVLALLIKMRKKIKPELWWIAFVLWLGPLLTKDLMSYTRYEIVSFPIFLYLAQILTGYKYWLVLFGFGVGLLLVSILFVNWYWIG